MNMRGLDQKQARAFFKDVQRENGILLFKICEGGEPRPLGLTDLPG